jgi:hypothetical protein
MRSSRAACVAFAVGLALSSLVSIAAGSPSAKETTSAVQWLQKANTLTSIRDPGATPFHLEVSFRAFPGMDFARKGKPTIITGDGRYEETWLSPEKWRREVTFTGYHAVEIRSNGVRKYLADSDYEPSRVLMMLDALLYPVPRNLISPEFAESHQSWKIDHLTAGTISYLTLTHREPGANNDWFYMSYSLLASGILVRSNYFGLVTSWEKGAVFAGKLVPLHFEVQALGHTLLTADVSITPAGQTDTNLFELDAPPATPGHTLRPFHMFEIKLAEFYDPISVYTGPQPRGVIREVIDRKGQARETELVDAPNPGDNVNQVDAERSKQFYPAKVDHDPCEEVFWMRG